VKRAAKLAKKLKSYLVLGASEKDNKGMIRNTAYFLDRTGKMIGRYYKLFANAKYKQGNDLPVFDTDFGKVGIVICADRRWPENIRVMRLKGARIIFNPTWGFYGEFNTALIRTRSFENDVPICFTHPLQSLICHSDIIAMDNSKSPSVFIHDVKLAMKIDDPELTHDMVVYRRPELYGMLSDSEYRSKKKG